MPDERTRHEQQIAASLPPPDDGPAPPDPLERFIIWAAGLPWWAIILVAVAVFVMYSMLSSNAYRRVIESLADDPQLSTDDKFTVVQIVGQEKTITGQYVSTTTDSPETVVDMFLDEVDSDQVDRPGFLAGEEDATITVRTADGLVTIPISEIEEPEVLDAQPGDDVVLTYIERMTVTGTMTEENDETMTVRTVDEVKQTFSKSRILSQNPCDPANPECDEGEFTILRQGEIIEGRLTALSATNISVDTGGDEPRQVRRSEVDYLNVPTLTIAVYAPHAGSAVQTGDEVKVGFVEGTDISAALEDLDMEESIAVSSRYTEGETAVRLVSYPDLDSALQAISQGEVTILIYLDSGPDRLAVQNWVRDNDDSGVVLARPAAECNKDCQVTVKLKDDELTGEVVEETDDQITIITAQAEFIVLDKDDILENRRKEPGVCALNNLRGCNAGLFLTIKVTFIAYFLAVLIGLFVGLLRVQTNPILYAASTLYVEVVRGIPLLVILLYAGFVISPKLLRDQLGINLSDEQEAILGLSFGYGAFIAEIFRAGIQSISKGQMEAARSLGMSYIQAMRHVVLPQAVRVVLPPLGNDFISMLKDSALISVLALPDLLQLGRLYVSRTFRAFEGYNTVAILYLIMTLFLSMLVRIIERRARLPR
jgi:polar amino acid transport system permease protein